MAFAILLPAIGFATIATLRVAASEKVAAEELLRDTARDLASLVDGEVRGQFAALTGLATSPAVVGRPEALDVAALDAHARRIHASIGAHLSVFRRDGTRIISTALPFGAPLPSSAIPEVIERVFRVAGPVVSNLVASGAIADAPVAALFLPVFDADNDVGFAAMSAFRVDLLRDLLARHGLPHASFAAIVDASGRVVARSDLRHAREVGLAAPPELRAGRAEHDAGVLRLASPADVERVAAFQAVPSLPGWTVVVAQEADAFASAWRGPLHALLLGGSVALLVGMLLATATARAILRPARRLAQGAHDLIHGDRQALDAPSPPSRIAEFAELELGLAEAAAASADRRQAEHDAAQLALRLQERTRALAEAGGELRNEIEQRRAAQALLSQMQKLEALGQMTSSVAHDFNNVLAAITACFRLIERRAGQAAAVLDIVRQGDRAAARAAALVRQLLAFARQEEPRPEVVVLGELLGEATEMIRHSVGQRLAVTVEAAPDVWPVLADPHQLEVALLNLAVNARDAMPHGGTLYVSARNLTRAEHPAGLRPGDYVLIAVRDAGTGMTPEVLARARDAFFTTKPRGKGTGLGLPMVERFAMQSRGVLVIDTSPGAGTTVGIVLPRSTISDARVRQVGGDDADASRVDPLAHGNASILLAEQDEQVRLLTATLLRDLGYTVIEAASAEAAEALAATMDRLDLLCTSLELPGADGAALAARLRAERPDLRVLFVTGGSPGPALAGETVLRKPLAGSSLAASVLAILDRRRPVQLPPAARLLKRLRTPAMRAAYLAWHAARLPGEDLPRVEAFGLDRLGLEAHGVLVAVENGLAEEPGFRFAKIGDALRTRLGRDLLGEKAAADTAEGGGVGTLVGAYRRCARTGAPVYEAARFDFGDGLPETFERLMLPLSSDGASVSHEVGVVLFGDAPA